MAGLFFAVIGSIFWGDWEERAAAIAALSAWCLTVLVLQVTQAWNGPHLGLFLVDLALFFALLGIGLRSAKVWPLAATGFQLAGLSFHVAYWTEPRVWSAAYFAGLEITSTCVLGVLIAAVLVARRRGAGARS